MKVICSFCGQEVVEEAEPSIVKSATGITYTCYKKICRNYKKHWSNGNIVIPYKHETKKTESFKHTA